MSHAPWRRTAPRPRSGGKPVFCMSLILVPRPIKPFEIGTLDVAVEPDFDFASAEYDSLHQRSRATAFQAPRWLDALHGDLAPAMAAQPVTITLRERDSRR